MRRLNVAFVTDSYKPNVDGVVQALMYLKEGLEDAGDALPLIITPSHTGKPFVKKEGSTTIVGLRSFPLPFYPSYRVGLISASKAMSLFKQHGIDLLHNHGLGITALSSGRAAKRLGIPRITTFHTNILMATHYLGPFAGIGYALGLHYFRWLFSYYERVVAPSKHVENYLRSVVKVPEKKLLTIPNGIDVECFAFRPRHGARPSSKLQGKRTIKLLHVGRVVKEKNIDGIMDFLEDAGLKNIELTVVGNGSYLEALKRKAKGLPYKVVFTGYVPNRELETIYSRHDALLFASPFDTQGLVVFEAMASGTPVLALKGTSAEEFVGSCGAVFSSPQELRALLLKLPSCHPNRKELSYKTTVKRYLKLYKELCRELYK